MHMGRLFGTLVLGNCASRTPGFAFVQLRGVTTLGSSVTRRSLREPPAAATTTSTAASPSNLASFPYSVRIGAGGVLALVLLSSSSRFSSEAASPVGWTRRSGRSLRTHRTPSMAIASMPGTGAGGDALVQKGVSTSIISRDDKLPVIFVLGGPGSGKGTQCEMLAKEYGYIHLSAGELLRRERESGSSDGQLIDEYIREGRIVPVAITLGLLKKAMQTSGPGSRFLIDGFPRNDDNRQGWEATMTDVCDVRCVLFLYCPEEVLEQRLLSRGKNSGRTDDNAEAAKKRFRTYVQTTLPVVEEYEREGLVTRVNGNQDIHTVFRDVISGLRSVQEKELLDAHRAAAAAASSGDWDAYADMCTPHVTELIGGGLSAAKTWGYSVESSLPSRARARMLNGGAGIVWCEHALPGEGELLRPLQETTVWEMSEGRWKCTHRHASPRSL